MEKVVTPSTPLPSMSNGITNSSKKEESVSTTATSTTSTVHSVSNPIRIVEEAPTSAGVVPSSHHQSLPEHITNGIQFAGEHDVKSYPVPEEGNKLIDSNASGTKVGAVVVVPLGESSERNNIASSSPSVNNCGSASEEVSNTNLVPNFHVEGSGLGDSSITVAVASLASAVPLSNSVVVPHASQGGPGGSGPASVQSSEEMKLSLVSWYSEPDDTTRIIGDPTGIPCCPQSSSLHLHNGRQAISMTSSVMSKSGSEEKENRTPEPRAINSAIDPSEKLTILVGCRNETSDTNSEGKNNVSSVSGQSQRTKMHVQLQDQGSSETPEGGKQHGCSFKKDIASFESSNGGKSVKPDCPRCSRRSKSGSTTPSSGHNSHCHSQSRIRTPANRRVIQSTKSSTELKKPIKSILKRESRGSGGSGSGSDNKSSMDSLGSSAEMGHTPLRPIMTRSDSGSRAKFNLNHQVFNETVDASSEDRFSSKMRRIEKYATLRMRKGMKVKPLDFSESDVTSCTSGGEQSSGCSKAGTPNEMMTKSMSFLEKSTVPRGESAPLNSSSSLRRQGSLRARKSPPVWEPCTTRTTALRMQKMQATKAKSGGGHHYSATPSSTNTNGHYHHSGSAHSGSGDSIHHLTHSTSSLHQPSTSGRSGNGPSPSSKSHIHSQSQMNLKDKVGGTTKVFAKLSSAFGHTASSNQKRLRQEKAIQTEEIPQTYHYHRGHYHSNGEHGSSLSPVPTVDGVMDLTDQIKRLEGLANRYRNTALRFQTEYEKSEAKKTELTKQLLEIQTESNEMIEFLQAEKSTLAESLTEIENEVMQGYLVLEFFAQLLNLSSN
jgi:hypothetical protein